MCLQKLTVTLENMVLLPENIKPFISTSLAWDNIDLLDKTLSGEGMSHRVNAIVVQQQKFGPHLPPLEAMPYIARSKKQSVNVILDKELLIYNAGDRCGPPPRPYVEVSYSEIEAIAKKKNLLWILVHLHEPDC